MVINATEVRLPLNQEPDQLVESRAAVLVQGQSALPLQACIVEDNNIML